MGFGVRFIATVPSDCSVYKVITKAPKGLGNFDEYVSAENPKLAKAYWKNLFSYMGNRVKVTDVVKLTIEEQNQLDITMQVMGKLDRKAVAFSD